MGKKDENEDDKKQMIKAEKGLFIGFIVIPMSLTLLIISLIGIYILNITIFELIIIIGFCIVLVIILRRIDNSSIRRKYKEV